MGQRAKVVAAVVAVVGAMGATAWQNHELPSVDSIGSVWSAPPSPTGPAAGALADLQVKGRAPMTGYDRDRFGSGWSDTARVDGAGNGCLTRNDVLRRDLTQVTIKPATQGCVVLSGTLLSPYTGETVPFERGEESGEVQVDHAVALADVWVKGGQQLSEQERVDVANDPLNLVAVEGAVNASKGAGDAATWRPPARSSWCSYAARQVAVKTKYELWVTVAEKRALGEMLERCPGQRLPTAEDVAVPPLGGGQ